MKTPIEITIHIPLNEATNYACIYEKRILDAKKEKRNLLIKTPTAWTLISPKELLKVELQEKKFRYDEPMKLRCMAFQNNVSIEEREKIKNQDLINACL